MAVHIVFKGTGNSPENTELELFCNEQDEIFISIESEGLPESWICLDKETAIKLSKHLKSQISLIPIWNGKG